MYELMLDRAGAAGYEHYEISNLCLPGFASLHNSKYWTGAPYYGFGCSAHSYDGKFRRWSNERDVAGYPEFCEAGRWPIVESLTRTEDEAPAEAVFLGLGMMSGMITKHDHNLFGTGLREQQHQD